MVGPDIKTWISIISVSIALSSLAVMTGARLRDQETNTDNIERLFKITESNAKSIAQLQTLLEKQSAILEYHKIAIEKNSAAIERK